jgi:thymidylate synthase (FAD)
MPVKFEYRGKRYKNAVELTKDIPLLTSVLVGWTDGAEILCANAGALCYDTNISPKIEVNKEMIKEMLEKDDFSNIFEAISYSPGKVGSRIIKHCRDSGHNTVIEHGSATFVKKVPMFVARQDLRARIASFDERSLRYCRAHDGGLTYYIPEYLSQEKIEKLKLKGEQDKATFLSELRQEWIDDHERAIERYSKYTDEELNEMWDALGLDAERVRETMRARLPIGINTMYIDTRNLWSWLHHSAKRLCLRAQKEIRVIRQQEVRQLKQVFPTLFGDVNMPCYMASGCSEAKKCGLIELDPSGRWALPYYKKNIEPQLIKSCQ